MPYRRRTHHTEHMGLVEAVGRSVPAGKASEGADCSTQAVVSKDQQTAEALPLHHHESRHHLVFHAVPMLAIYNGRTIL